MSKGFALKICFLSENDTIFLFSFDEQRRREPVKNKPVIRFHQTKIQKLRHRRLPQHQEDRDPPPDEYKLISSSFGSN